MSSDCELQSAPSRHRSILLLNCIDVLSENADTSLDYWHASHEGSSIAQNLMSVAGVASAVVAAAADNCVRAAAAAASSALPPPAPFATAFRRPDCTVDFSACVALVVRR